MKWRVVWTEKRSGVPRARRKAFNDLTNAEDYVAYLRSLGIKDASVIRHIPDAASVPGLPSSFPVGSVSGSPHGAHAYNVEPLEEEG